jgi:hypothetical protein
LRIPTLSVLFAMACAFLIPPHRIEDRARMSSVSKTPHPLIMIGRVTTLTHFNKSIILTML